MDDYISREAAIALTDQHCFETSYDAVWMEEELRKLPAADVVEVVRCKDCTYFNHVKCQEKRAGLCEHFNTYMYISDYCSDGDRRDDNGK